MDQEVIMATPPLTPPPRARWRHHLARDVYHRPFTAREDDELLRLHYRLGDRWKEIGRAVYGRTSRVMKHRWRELRRGGFPAAATRKEQAPAMDADDMVESEMEESDQSLPPLSTLSRTLLPRASVLAALPTTTQWIPWPAASRLGSRAWQFDVT
ncbi:hypothetical protein OsJ_24027 [Oryza sativa Japonica Group]|uniref:Uncharacterized protein n=2 Tax=Oryza TaxID=4527 RepID=A3BJ53_ORYSJ|nr:hypothetical protein OsJ_24027 [Oryza sativa Japonica Group]